jgi:hypothetical protein
MPKQKKVADKSDICGQVRTGADTLALQNIFFLKSFYVFRILKISNKPFH